MMLPTVVWYVYVSKLSVALHHCLEMRHPISTSVGLYL